MLNIESTLLLGENLIREFLDQIKEELIDYLDSNDRNATGRSKASFQVVNVTSSSGQLIGSESIEFVFRGRGPGKMPPLNAIIDWCNVRGIPRAAAWVIAKRIAEAGTKLHRQGRDFLKETIKEQRINEFSNKLTAIYSAQIKTDIENLLAA